MANVGDAGLPEQTSFVIAVTGLAFEARIAAEAQVKVVCDTVASRLAETLEKEASHPGCRGIISFGTSGGLDPKLLPGDWVVANTIVHGSIRVATDPLWTRALMQALPGALEGVIAAASEPVMSVSEKSALRAATGALAVDMESYVAAGVAQRRGIAFAACRVVIDPAWRALPAFTRVAVHPDGRTAPGRILVALARHPSELWVLFCLARDAHRARASLIAGRGGLGPQLSLPAP